MKLAAVVAGAIELWAMPPLVTALYAVGSIVCFTMYAVDKAAARAGRWRVRAGLHLLTWAWARTVGEATP